MACNTCNPNCYTEVQGSCVEYDGLTIGPLESGSSISQGLEALGGAVETLQSEIGNCACGGGSSTAPNSSSAGTSNPFEGIDLSCLQGGLEQSYSSSQIKIDTVLEASSLTVSYDLVEAIKSCGTLVSVRASIKGKYRGSDSIVELGNNNSAVGAFVIDTSSCPATFEVNAKVNTDSGQKTLTFSRPLVCETTSFTDSLLSTGVSGDRSKSLCSKINSLESSVNRLLNLQVGGSDIGSSVVNLQSTINTQNTTISNLETKIAELEAKIDECCRTV